MNSMKAKINWAFQFYFFSTWLGLLLFFAGLLALPAIQHGAPPVIALLRAMTTAPFFDILLSTCFLLWSFGNVFAVPTIQYTNKNFPPNYIIYIR
jgi:hypothetical protein